MSIRVDFRAILLTTVLAAQIAPAFSQEDPRANMEEKRRAEEERKMSEAKRAADRVVDRKSYASQDVSREQLGQLTPSPTPSAPKPASDSPKRSRGR